MLMLMGKLCTLTSSFSQQLILLIIWFLVLHVLAATTLTGLFDPVEISPLIPRDYHFNDTLPPLYPTFPTIYDPNLTGRCPANFSAISSLASKTAADCSQLLAPMVGDVICCPQLDSLLHLIQRYNGMGPNSLVLTDTVSNDCFSDIISILVSRGADSKLPSLCSVSSKKLTGGSCPVKDTKKFEKIVNTTRLLEACSSVDPLKECCLPVCQPAIAATALQISGFQLIFNESDSVVDPQPNIIGGCKDVVYSYLSQRLSLDSANDAFRILSACKVNKVCPLNFTQPSDVISACHNIGISTSCCSSVNTYISGLQQQMLITNKQAIICAKVFGSMLQEGGIMINVYEECNIDLKDFSIQAYGQQGCLLKSLPSDIVVDRSTGFGFVCDLSDNIAAPWPSSVSYMSLCASELSLPSFPTSETLKSTGNGNDVLQYLMSFSSSFFHFIV